MTTETQLKTLERKAKKRRAKKPQFVVLWPGDELPDGTPEDATIIHVTYVDGR